MNRFLVLQVMQRAINNKTLRTQKDNKNMRNLFVVLLTWEAMTTSMFMLFSRLLQSNSQKTIRSNWSTSIRNWETEVQFLLNARYWTQSSTQGLIKVPFGHLVIQSLGQVDFPTVHVDWQVTLISFSWQGPLVHVTHLPTKWKKVCQDLTKAIQIWELLV